MSFEYLEKLMKKHNAFVLACTLLFGGASAIASSHGGAPIANDAKVEPSAKANANASMADGEIRKIDMENKKITIKHGVIKNLDMPGMTMVFQVKDSALLSKAKVGDKVRFSAEQSGNTIVVTAIEASK